MRRNVNFLRLFGNIYIAVILAYIAFSYYVLMYRNVLTVSGKTFWTYLHILFMHICLVLLLTSFFQTIIGDPGKVPLFWGFFLDDPDNRRRRYCLICHIFKPERSHHCSACNRCVLNMDHHCPWLNNCVGFYNRKFFLLLLFYTILIKTENFLYYLPIWIHHVIIIFESGFITAVDPHYLTLICYLMNTGMLVVVGMFFRFHVTLVMQNMTTIEHMDRKRGSEARNEVLNYDMGIYYNFVQIFGKNPWLWFIPVFLKSGKPIGDGVVWPQKPTNAYLLFATQRYEIDMSIRNVTGNRDSEQGSATRERVSPLNNDNLGQNERNQTPFNTTPIQQQSYQGNVNSGYPNQVQAINQILTQGQPIAQPPIHNAQNGFMPAPYRPQERIGNFSSVDQSTISNQMLSERNRPLYTPPIQGVNYGNYRADGSFRNQNNVFS